MRKERIKRYIFLLNNLKIKNIYSFLRAIFKRKKFRIKYFDEIKNENSHNNSLFSYEEKKEKIQTYKFFNKLKFKSLYLVNFNYKYFLMKDVYVIPYTDLLFDKHNCWLSNREKEINGKNFFELHQYDSLLRIILGVNKFYLKFNNDKCIISDSVFSSKLKYLEGINLLSAINNYWHFLIETAPKILLANHLEIPKNIPFLITDSLHPNLYEILDVLNSKLDKRKIVKVPSTIRNPSSIKIANLYNILDHINLPLHIPTRIMRQKSFNIQFDKNPIIELIEIIKNHYDIKSEIDEKTKLFLYRQGTSRISKDQDKLKEFLINRGYQVFNPSKMSFKEQVVICSKASSFIGFSGAGFTNSCSRKANK